MQEGNKPTIVMCTVKSRSQHISMAMAAGIDEYIEKPFNIDKLTEVLMRLGFC
jgi:DNA-binding response OmpR family regulator